jgi:hypothetical protein
MSNIMFFLDPLPTQFWAASWAALQAADKGLCRRVEDIFLELKTVQE